MSPQRIALRPADERLDYVERVLERNDLPSDDVRSKPGCFYIAHAGDDRIGIGGIERRGDSGLLRSLVVEDAARGDGYGTAIRERLEATAREDGIERVYLLTTTAPAFFTAAGYTRIERAAAPDPIRETTQFADLCPASATLMRKQL